VPTEVPVLSSQIAVGAMFLLPPVDGAVKAGVTTGSTVYVAGAGPVMAPYADFNLLKFPDKDRALEGVAGFAPTNKGCTMG
jgi:hypothetical protein